MFDIPIYPKNCHFPIMFDIPFLLPLYTISETWQLKIHYKWYMNLNGNNISTKPEGGDFPPAMFE